MQGSSRWIYSPQQSESQAVCSREAQRGFTWDNVEEGRQGEESEKKRWETHFSQCDIFPPPRQAPKMTKEMAMKVLGLTKAKKVAKEIEDFSLSLLSYSFLSSLLLSLSLMSFSLTRWHIKRLKTSPRTKSLQPSRPSAHSSVSGSESKHIKNFNFSTAKIWPKYVHKYFMNEFLTVSSQKKTYFFSTSSNMCFPTASSKTYSISFPCQLKKARCKSCRRPTRLTRCFSKDIKVVFSHNMTFSSQSWLLQQELLTSQWATKHPDLCLLSSHPID